MSENNEEFAEENQFQEMSKKKQVIWRIISIIFFGLVIWGVVAITDFVLEFIKSMVFSG